MKLNSIVAAAIISLAGLSFASQATVQLSANRLFYSAKNQDVNITVKNVEDREYLVQSWVDAKGNPELEHHAKLPFIVSPPLFHMANKSEAVVQMMYSGEGLPTDRESLVWLDVKAIPAMTDGEKKVKTKVMVAVLTRIKVFYRPENLPGNATDAIAALSWKKEANNTVTVKNDSPYYVVMNKVKINDDEVKVSIEDNNTVVAPHGSKTYPVKTAKAGTKVTWSAINEYSVVSAEHSVTL